MEYDIVKNPRGYEFQYTEAPVTPTSFWTHVSNTKRKINVNGLTPGVE